MFAERTNRLKKKTHECLRDKCDIDVPHILKRFIGSAHVHSQFHFLFFLLRCFVHFISFRFVCMTCVGGLLHLLRFRLWICMQNCQLFHSEPQLATWQWRWKNGNSATSCNTTFLRFFSLASFWSFFIHIERWTHVIVCVCSWLLLRAIIIFVLFFVAFLVHCFLNWNANATSHKSCTATISTFCFVCIAEPWACNIGIQSLWMAILRKELSIRLFSAHSADEIELEIN